MAHRCPACGYAIGGEVPVADLGRKRDVELPEVDDPDYQLDVYRGETAKERDEEKRNEKNTEADFAAAIKRRKARGL